MSPDKSRFGDQSEEVISPAIPPTDIEKPHEILSSGQRTALERIIVRIHAVSKLSSVELWAGLRHQLAVGSDQELMSRHFFEAESWLNQRLLQEQENHSRRRVLQQLSELLPIGNNRQAVNVYIREQFGQTVLSGLNGPQLDQLFTNLQQGHIAIPELKNQVTDRSLLPAEHHNLHQQIITLSASCGDSTRHLWGQLYQLLGLKHGDPIPSRAFQLLSQYLQARKQLVQHKALTLAGFLSLLKNQPNSEELLLLQQHYQRLTHALSLPLSSAQSQALLHQLFLLRAATLLRTPPPCMPTQGHAQQLSSAKRLTHYRSWLLSGLGLLLIVLCFLFMGK